MNYWLFVCTDNKDNGEVIRSRDVWNRRKRDGVWGLGEGTPNRSKVRKGDRLIFYVGGRKEKVFVGAATAASMVYNSNSLSKQEKERRRIGKQKISKYFIDMKKVTEFEREPFAINMIAFLSIFQGVKGDKWGSRLNGGIRTITWADYELIARVGSGSDFDLGNTADPELYKAFREGNRRLVRHLEKERSFELRKNKIKEYLDTNRSLSCEVCGFDFNNVYGHIMKAFCEVHHILPLSKLKSNTIVYQTPIVRTEFHWNVS